MEVEFCLSNKSTLKLKWGILSLKSFILKLKCICLHSLATLYWVHLATMGLDPPFAFITALIPRGMD